MDVRMPQVQFHAKSRRVGGASYFVVGRDPAGMRGAMRPPSSAQVFAKAEHLCLIPYPHFEAEGLRLPLLYYSVVAGSCSMGMSQRTRWHFFSRHGTRMLKAPKYGTPHAPPDRGVERAPTLSPLLRLANIMHSFWATRLA